MTTLGGLLDLEKKVTAQPLLVQWQYASDRTNHLQHGSISEGDRLRKIRTGQLSNMRERNLPNCKVEGTARAYPQLILLLGMQRSFKFF